MKNRVEMPDNETVMYLLALGIGVCFLLCVLVSMWSIKKVRVDSRVAGALERMESHLTSPARNFIYICKSFPKAGDMNWTEWIRSSGKCELILDDTAIVETR